MLFGPIVCGTSEWSVQCIVLMVVWRLPSRAEITDPGCGGSRVALHIPANFSSSASHGAGLITGEKGFQVSCFQETGILFVVAILAPKNRRATGKKAARLYPVFSHNLPCLHHRLRLFVKLSLAKTFPHQPGTQFGQRRVYNFFWTSHRIIELHI